MLLGEYQHNLDVKGRMIVPAKLREELKDHFIITKGLDKCLLGYALPEWRALEEKIKALPVTDSDIRRFVRFFFGGACECDVDAQGRVLIPQNLREYAGIVKEIVTIGVSTRIEIWGKENWESYNDESNFIDDELAKRMAQFGI